MREETAIMKLLWTQSGGVDFDGEFHSSERCPLRPEASAKALPEILSGRRVRAGGGHVCRAFRRAFVLG